jgi:hypothetical protein
MLEGAAPSGRVESVVVERRAAVSDPEPEPEPEHAVQPAATRNASNQCNGFTEES